MHPGAIAALTPDKPAMISAETGRAVTFRGVTWVRVRGGKLAEGWQCSNVPDVLRGLAAPIPG